MRNRKSNLPAGEYLPVGTIISTPYAGFARVLSDKPFKWHKNLSGMYYRIQLLNTDAVSIQNVNEVWVAGFGDVLPEGWREFLKEIDEEYGETLSLSERRKMEAEEIE